MINKSFQLLRTNPLLTTNFKVVVASDYSLYMESFNSNNQLNNVNYKHFAMTKNEYLENKIPAFYKKLPIDLAFDVRYDNDNNIIQSNFQNQFDTTYYAGGGYVEDQWYTEEFDYLAPLYIRRDSIPMGFIILRVDDPSDYNLNNDNDFELSKLDNTNFRSEVLENWKCVKYFDMTYTTNFGQWLTLNYTNNDRVPKTAFYYHPERAEFSYWYGIDYNSGIYTYKPIFMDDRDAIETPHFRWEKFITEGYKRSGLIFPFILNLKFLFDDTPATPTSLRKYSMNRYYGFYLDSVDFVGSITPYRTPEMIPNTYLVNNIIVSGTTGFTQSYCDLDNIFSVPTVNPFVEKWNDNKSYFVYIDNTSDFYRDKTVSGLYPVVRVKQDGVWIWKVISDDIMDSYWNTGYTNIKTCDINYSTFNILSGYTGDFFIDKYIDCDGNEKYMYGDLYLIRIGDKFHVIRYSSGITYSDLNIGNKNDLITDPVTGDPDSYKYYIQSDYAINMNSKLLEYWILGKNSPYYTSVQSQPTGQIPLTLPIYRIKFSDIKDFDFDRVVTNYSDFDYEKTEYVTTDEEKLYAFDYNDESIPPSKRTERAGSTSQYRISNVSSEYLADDELFEVYSLGQQLSTTGYNGVDDKLYDLTDLWRKNQSNCKWGFMGSISHSDYPYKMNNNYEVGGPFNRTVDPYSTIPNVVNKNLDYFYRIGNFYNASPTSYNYYKNQSTNIQYDFITDQQLGTGFNLDAYFGGGNIDFDYFTFFFKNKMYYEDGSILYTKAYDKYSVFNFGDDNVSSVTLFKGLKITLKQIQNIYLTQLPSSSSSGSTSSISSILFGNANYNNYKLSIVFNENHNGTDSGLLFNNGYLDTQNDGINIILNEKYQNILIIINASISGASYLNDVSIFNEKDGLYYGKKKDGTYINFNPSTFTAYNFIRAINDYNNNYGLYVRYYYIKEIDGVLKWGKTLANNFVADSVNGMTNIWSYIYQPFLLTIDTPVNIALNNNCYSTDPYYVNSVPDDYVATILTFDESKSSKVSIYRYPGPYEPIFKDVNLFKGGFFCYNNVTGITSISTGSTYALSTPISVFEIPVNDGYSWLGLNNMDCSNNTSYVYVNMTPPHLPHMLVQSNYLCINNFDFSSVPSDAIVTGITLDITRLSNVSKTTDIFVSDNQVRLNKNCYLADSHWSANRAIPGDAGVWDNNLTTITYGHSKDLWNTDLATGLLPENASWSGSTITGSDIKNPNFGAIIQVGMRNNGPIPLILPQIKCVKLTVYYMWRQTRYTADRTVYFDNNYRFDESLNDFGNIDELIFSKVNEQINVLSNMMDVYKIYPCVDEFGYEYASRFIFKSSWDKEFFIKTESTYNDQSGVV